MNSRVISIRQVRLEPDINGEYTVSRRELQGVDLCHLPQETRMFVENHPKRHGASVEVFSIDGPNPDGFGVLANFQICPHCWKHTLAYHPFMEAVGNRLDQLFRVGDNYVDSYEVDGGICHTIATRRREHTIEDIEVAMKLEIDDALAQLSAYANQLDLQVKRQLGV